MFKFLTQSKMFKKPNCIEPFQLENLIRGFVGFQFFNLSQEMIQLNEKWEGLIQGAQRVPPHQALHYILENHSDPSTPIVLMCERGRHSVRICRQLTRRKYLNVHALLGGLKGLSQLSSLE